MIEKDAGSTISFLMARLGLLESNISYLDLLLKRCGFEDGIVTLCKAAEELSSSEEDFI